jgi:hypothetical protein
MINRQESDHVAKENKKKKLQKWLPDSTQIQLKKLTIKDKYKDP